MNRYQVEYKNKAGQKLTAIVHSPYVKDGLQNHIADTLKAMPKWRRAEIKEGKVKFKHRLLKEEK